jgi:signal transduction histidine kinase
MNIRTKITVTFFAIVVVMLSCITFAIYYFSSQYREVDFHRRLLNRGMNTAKVLTEVKELNVELIKRLEKSSPTSLPNQHVAIYNPQHKELYRSEASAPLLVDNAFLIRISKEHQLKMLIDGYDLVGFTYQNQGHNYLIVAAARDDFGWNALKNLRFVLLTTFLISVAVVSILAWIYAGRILRPISKIVTDVSNITEENLSLRLDEGNSHDEVSRLAQTFNKMLSRLQEAFSSQKGFIANASHEIKTPITIMAGEIEVALLQQRERDYYVRVLQSVLNSLRGLNNLSSQLLLLAQTSTDQPEKKFTILRIDDILWEIKDEMMKVYPTTDISILFDLNLHHESLVTRGDEQLIKVAILNLMDNACKYSDDNKVIINLFEKERNSLSIEFQNKSKRIDPDNIQRLFSPFYRGKHDKKVRGYGIGLSLVEKIIALHKAKIEVTSNPAGITNFTITFQNFKRIQDRLIQS